MDIGCAAQLTFGLGGLLGQDVALERLAPLDGAPRANAEPLGRALLGLHFGHDCSFLIAPAGAGKRCRLVSLQSLLWRRAVGNRTSCQSRRDVDL